MVVGNLRSSFAGAELRRLLLSEAIVRRMEKVAQLSRPVRELWAVSSELVAAHRAALCPGRAGDRCPARDSRSGRRPGTGLAGDRSTADRAAARDGRGACAADSRVTRDGAGAQRRLTRSLPADRGTPSSGRASQARVRRVSPGCRAAVPGGRVASRSGGEATRSAGRDHAGMTFAAVLRLLARFRAREDHRACFRRPGRAAAAARRWCGVRHGAGD